ncbi:transposase, partial [Thiolapillus sp.]|uniref:transposase n=1 Tax=Thiolapillus sp. TaxID=2017437 RepID=UPI003AF54897
MGDNHLKGSRYCWLANEENIDKKRAEQFDVLKTSDLKVARAWAIKEMFRGFWDYRYAGWAKRHFDRWYAWAIRGRLTPIKKNKRVFGLVIDFGTSQSPKSTRPLTTYSCPSRPGHPALRNNFASSLLLRTCLPMTDATFGCLL